MIESNLFLYLASGEIDGDGFWIIDTTLNESPFIDKSYLLECYRKELIGQDAAKEIMYAINLNLRNILNELNREGHKIEKPIRGISFSLPLTLIENIFDFWIERYKDPLEWETCIGLLKIKQRFSLTSMINSNGIKGNAKEWAPKIENLHNYHPNNNNKLRIQNPMWNE